MPPTLSWSFGLFQLDPVSGCLWPGEQLMPLPPKPPAVLAYLVAHAGQVVSKDALLAAVWLEVVVTEGVLKTCLGQIRQVLGETAKRPQHIVTVHRRGYRFIAPMTIIEPTPAQETSRLPPDLPPMGQLPGQRSTPSAPELIVGREIELVQLQRWWMQALQGTWQTVFVAGEAGIARPPWWRPSWRRWPPLGGTYRPVEAIVQTHPVRAVMQELLLHGQCAELAAELAEHFVRGRDSAPAVQHL